jgi:hypothetical protein
MKRVGRGSAEDIHHKLIMFDLIAMGAAFFGTVGAFKHHGELRRRHLRRDPRSTAEGVR